MDNAIRFQTIDSPDQRFLHVDVTGRTLKLCRLTEQHGDIFSWETVAANPRVPVFRAFDWHPTDNAWVAVGQSSGEASLVHLNERQEIISFQFGKPRLCNAVALSSQNLLATGLDKVRTDFCLNIWDIHQRVNPVPGGVINTSKVQTEPLHKLAGSEPIASLKFFRDQPRTIVAGVKGQFVRLYDLRDPSESGGLQFQTKCVNNIAICGHDENYFASCFPTGDPEICLWDRRMRFHLDSTGVSYPGVSDNRQPEVSLEIQHAISHPGSIWSLRFSRSQRGCLGVLSSTGEVRVFNVLQEFMSDEMRTENKRKYGSDWEHKLPQPVFIDRIDEVQRPYLTGADKQEDLSRVASFDFMPDHTMFGRAKMLALMGDGLVKAISPAPEVEPAQLSAAGNFVLGGEDLESHLPSTHDSVNILAAIDKAKSQPGHLNSSFMNQMLHHERQFAQVKITTQPLQLLSRPRERILAGYLVNPEKNQNIVADSPWLQAFWKWVAWASQISKSKAMVQDNLDLSHLGVYALWMEEVDASTREIGADTRIGNIRLQAASRIESLTKRLNIRRGKMTIDTIYPSHRQLCLYVSDLAKSTEEVKSTVKDLVVAGEYTYAAAFALFHDERKLAYEALRGEGTQQTHQMLAMAIAGAPKRSESSNNAPSNEDGAESAWSETLSSISASQTDPYARAILAYVRTGDYRAIVAEESLPLNHRLLVALKWYTDSDLTKYVKDIHRHAVEVGDIEGIVLTGLGTSSAFNLLQNYITRFGDLQTAVLALAVDGAAMKYNHTNPSLMRRYEAWQKEYASQIMSWGLKFDRVRFELAIGKGAVDVNGNKLIKPPPPQIRLVCSYCTGSLAHSEATTNAESDAATGPPPKEAGGKMNASVAAATGTVCPKCARHLPRCGVCDLWLGTPDPTHMSWYKEPEENEEHKRAATRRKLGETEEEAAEKAKWGRNMGRFLLFCAKCSHGFHAVHAREWFTRYRVCPVSDCKCLCGL